MSLKLGIAGYTFADLYDPNRLQALDAEFVRGLETADPNLAAVLKSGRSDPYAISALELSEFLVRLAPRVSEFLTKLFPIASALGALERRASDDAVLSRFKRDFLVRRAAKATPPPDLATADVSKASSELRQFERTAFP